MRVIEVVAHGELRDTISHDWTKWLQRIGVDPVLLPNTLINIGDFLGKTMPDAILLSSGNNVGRLPGEAEEPTDAYAVRDRTEYSTIAYAVEHNIPVLGVCHGFQELNVYLGGGLVRDVASIPGGGSHVGAHEIQIVDPPTVEALGRSRVTTNSFHNQGVSMATMATELVPLAVASGGIVEAFFHPDSPLFGVQWHPERPETCETLDRLIVERWLGTCR